LAALAAFLFIIIPEKLNTAAAAGAINFKNILLFQESHLFSRTPMNITTHLLFLE
jgi:hypothetical protein